MPKKRSVVRPTEGVKRSQTFRLDPTARQVAVLDTYVAVNRALWNTAVTYLLRRRDDGRTIDWREIDLGGAVTAARAVELTYRGQTYTYGDVPSTMLHGTLGHLKDGWSVYRANLKAGRRASPPGFRSAVRGPWSVRYQTQHANGPRPLDKVLVDTGRGERWRALFVPQPRQSRLPALGVLRCRVHRELPADTLVGDVIIHRDHVGDWWATLRYETAAVARTKTGAVTGVDRGVRITAVTAAGESFVVPANRPGADARRLRLEQTMARQRRANPCPADRYVTRNGRTKKISGRCTCDPGLCWKTSKRYQKAKTAVAKLRRHTAKRTLDATHNISRTLADRYDVVALENLKIENMTRSASGTAENPGRNVAQKRGLNRSILRSGWGSLGTQLTYKTTVERVPPAYTSQRCPGCDTVDKASRQGALYRCVSCGFSGDADRVGAWNIGRAAGLDLGPLPENLDLPNLLAVAPGRRTVRSGAHSGGGRAPRRTGGASAQRPSPLGCRCGRAPRPEARMASDAPIRARGLHRVPGWCVRSSEACGHSTEEPSLTPERRMTMRPRQPLWTAGSGWLGHPARSSGSFISVHRRQSGDSP